MQSSRSQVRLTSVVHARGWQQRSELGPHAFGESQQRPHHPRRLAAWSTSSPDHSIHQQHRLTTSPIWLCYALSITTLRKAFTPHARQDVQKQLRQRLRHIVSQLAIQDTSQDSELILYSSPQGRIFQVEYAQEAVKQGSVVVGIVSKTHAVLAAIKVSLPSLMHLG
jgi:hypothetical protein